jgi:anti-anti-sigma regulatory factor
VTDSSSISVGDIGEYFWMSVNGRGCFQNSPQIKSCLQRKILTGQRKFVVDLDQCPSLDSTFMGTLASTAIRLSEYPEGGEVHIINANHRNRQLLTSLGLHYLLQIDQDGSTLLEERKLVDRARLMGAPKENTSREEQAQLALEAHESLAEVQPVNATRFQDVVEFLKKEVEAGQS